MNISNTTNSNFDFLALGEALVDFISSEVVTHLEAATHFERFTGGQVANLAVNMARLGNQVALGACVGDDGFGRLIREWVAEAGVNTDHIQISTKAPTTLIPVTRTTRGTPEFSVYRGADIQLQAESALLAAAAGSKIVHTSAFGLSRQPARATILRCMQAAREKGNRVSLDPNYHSRVWPDVPDFLPVLRDAFQYVNITKPSLDDCSRLFEPGLDPADYARKFLDWGAEIVAITLGAEGVYLATSDGERHRIAPKPIDVVDVTGAGDAFWSGLLTALLDGRSALDAVRVGQAVAAIKIGTLGPLKQLDRTAIFASVFSEASHPDGE